MRVPSSTRTSRGVTHADTAEAMAVTGKDVERHVLSRAVKAFVEGRVFLVGSRTVVFP